jgi:O-6-methylguanine DNA methyltransferase
VKPAGILIRAEMQTPLGPMLAVASPAGLCALEFSAPQRAARLHVRLARWFNAAPIVDGDTPVLEQTRGWLRRYFAGEDADATSLPLDMCGTAFERRVWAALLGILPGQTTTYGAIAVQLGSSGAARAVGLANGANSLAIVVPCHRVIGADRTLTGYGGGLERKRWLIDHESRWRLPHGSPGTPEEHGRLPLDG